MVKKLWDDPVWNKVIAGAILAILTALGKYVFNLPWRILALTVVSVLIVAALAWWLQKKWKVRAQLKAFSVDDFSHVPLIELTVKNPGPKAVSVAAVEFVTMGQWSMPDPLRMGTMVPVVRELNRRRASYITILAEKGSVATKALAAVIKPKELRLFTFRLVTNFSEGNGFGLYPFYLRAELIYGKRNSRLRLGDLIVSLHAHTSLSHIEYGSPIFPFDPSTVQHDANAVLSLVQQGAQCPPEILQILKKQARI